jgi:hypothetical protein
VKEWLSQWQGFMSLQQQVVWLMQDWWNGFILCLWQRISYCSIESLLEMLWCCNVFIFVTMLGKNLEHLITWIFCFRVSCIMHTRTKKELPLFQPKDFLITTVRLLVNIGLGFKCTRRVVRMTIRILYGKKQVGN